MDRYIAFLDYYTTYRPSEGYRLAVAKGAREEGEEVTVSSQVANYAHNAIGDAFFSGLANGTVRVVGEISADRREYTFTLVDERGKVLDRITDVSNPVDRNMSLGGIDNMRLNAAMEASRPTPR